MKVVWDKIAERNRDDIGYYILERFGAERMDRFMEEVEQTAQMIMRHPAIGPIDPLFAERQKDYRSVIVGGLSKMVYRIDGDAIHIVAFWDCRQEPETRVTQIAENAKERS